MCIFLTNGSIFAGAGCMRLNLARIAIYMRKLSTVFEIKDHLGFLKICNFDPTNRFWLVPDVCGLNFVRIALYLRKLSTFLEIQDGGRRHLGF